MKTLIAYYSGKGFVKEAAERLQGLLGEDSRTFDLGGKEKVAAEDYDTLVIAGAFRAGQLPGRVKRFVKKNEALLMQKKLAFLLAGLEIDKWQSQYDSNIPEELRAHAVKAAHAGGRFKPEDYGMVLRKIMEKINQDDGPVLKENWAALDELAQSLR